MKMLKMMIRLACIAVMMLLSGRAQEAKIDPDDIGGKRG